MTSSLVATVDTALALVAQSDADVGDMTNTDNDSANAKASANANSGGVMDMFDILTEVPIIDLSPLISCAATTSKDTYADNNTNNNDESSSSAAANDVNIAIQAVSKAIVHSLHTYGIVICRDPRITFEKNNEFLDMMEDYFDQTEQQKMKDVRAELSYQVGVTPSRVEKPRNRCSFIETLDPQHRPVTPCPPEKDPKWRYFYRLLSKQLSDEESLLKFETLNAANVIPEHFVKRKTNTNANANANANNESASSLDSASSASDSSEFYAWQEICESWGNGLLNSALSIATGIAIGLGLPADYFTAKMRGAPHLLAPTATDMNAFGALNTVIAGFHNDLNFLTMHGKSRYPGLDIWLRDGTNRRVAVSMPDGCLLCQSAKQLEWITGGYIYAGFHEVSVNANTVNTIRHKRAEQMPLWRISSTMFSHMRSNAVLNVLPQFLEGKDDSARQALLEKYPPIEAGTQVMQELQAINLLQ